MRCSLRSDGLITVMAVSNTPGERAINDHQMNRGNGQSSIYCWTCARLARTCVTEDAEMDDLRQKRAAWGIESRVLRRFRQRHHAPARETLSGWSRRFRPARRAAAALRRRARPQRAFQGDGRRRWALAVQLYALRSGRNWGHRRLHRPAGLVELAAARGAAGIGLNPLHALFADRAEEASPTRRTAGCFSIRSTSTSRRSRNLPARRGRTCSGRSRRCAQASWSTMPAWRAPS